MAAYDGRGTQFDLVIPSGADMAFTVTATDSADAAIDLSAATIAGELYDNAGTVVDTLTHVVSGAGSNVITLSLTDTETAALVGVARWTLWVTRGGDKRPWLAGRAQVVAGSSAQTTTGSNLSLVVDTDVNVAVSVNAIGGSGGGASTLGDLDDVTITSPVSGNVVSYDGTGWVNSTPAGGGDLLAANNLSDLDDAATARTNLGLGSAATTASTDYATAAQGSLADSATQPGDLATVATTGDYDDLTNLPTLGTAAATDATDYATAAQGSLADSATQPGDLGELATLDLVDLPDVKQVWNSSGVTIPAGTLVEATGSAGAITTVRAADKDTANNVTGLTLESIVNGAAGTAQISGVSQIAVNTNGLGAAAPLWLGDAGAFTATRPTSGAIIRVGLVAVVAPTGSVVLDLPSFEAEAIDTAYDPTASSLAATSVQAAIDEVVVQAFDTDILKADTADTLTAGFDSSDHAAGTKSSGTYTPAASDGNFQVATNGGAHTLAPPTTSCSIVIHYTNNGSAGAITTSGFTAVTGDAFTTTDTHEFVCVVTKVNDVSVLNVTALQ